MSKDTLFDTVRRILLFNEGARDCYHTLDKFYYPESIPFGVVQDMIRDGELPAIESVHRARRQVQKECPELAGRTKKLRDLKEVDIRQTINDNPEQSIMGI